jgi:hypothetical protein
VVGVAAPAPAETKAPNTLEAADGARGVVAATFDRAAGVLRYRTCDASPCVPSASDASLPIQLDREKVAPGGLEGGPVAIGEGRRVLHVRIAESGSSRAFEAVLAAGQREPLFAGLTGFVGGEIGERSGKVVQVLPRDMATSFVLVGDVRENVHICGQVGTPLDPRVLDPKTLAFRGATVQRLTAEQRAAARPVLASALRTPAPPPMARLLVPIGTSVPGQTAAPLVDGSDATSWSEARPGDGHGEFALLRAAHEVPIARLAFTLLPAKPGPNAAAPKTLYVVGEQTVYRVTFPEDAAAHPGEAYEIRFPEPLRASCLAIVLDEAYAHGAHPEVTVAGITAYSEFDGPDAGWDALTAALAGGGARAAAAAGVLKRGGDEALQAALERYDALDPSGRALVVDVAAGTTSCDASANVLVRAFGDRDVEVARKARIKLERCGKSASPAMAEALRRGDDGTRAKVAPLFAAVAPKDAIEPLASALARGDAKTRREIRQALGSAARHAEPAQIDALLSAAPSAAPGAEASHDATVEVLRALSPVLASHKPAARAALERALDGTPDLRTRYLLLGPVATLAREGDADARTRLEASLASDPAPMVRTHAAALAEGVPNMAAALARAMDDDSPRVREAALRSGRRMASALVKPAKGRLEGDPFPFVRTAAATLLAASPAGSAGAEVDAALAQAVSDRSSRVREAAIAALAARRAGTAAPSIAKRLDDRDEEPSVRVAAARALGVLCAGASLELLSTLAQRAVAPVDEAERAVAMAAIAALGDLHPPDLKQRLAPVLGEGPHREARAVAQRALASPGVCRSPRP